MHVSAHIVVPDADEASAWYAKAFGAEERSRIPLPGGKVMTAEVAFGDSVVHVGSEFPEMGILSPLAIGGTATVLQIDTDDADALWQRALDAARKPITSSPTRSGASATASSPTRSATAGTSPSASATSRTTRSSQPRRRRSADVRFPPCEWRCSATRTRTRRRSTP